MEPFEIQTGFGEVQDPLSRAEYFTVSVRRFMAYSVLSSGMWPLYWFFRNWQAVRKAGYKKKFSPLLRTLFFNFTAFSLLKKILLGAQRAGYQGNYNPSQLAVFLFVVGFLSRGFEKLPAMPIGLLLVVLVGLFVLEPVILSPAVEAIQYLSVKQGRDLKENNKLTAGQVALFALGALAWLGLLSGK